MTGVSHSFAKPLSYRRKEGVVEGSLDAELPLFLTIEGDDATSSLEDEFSPLVLNLQGLKHTVSGSMTEDDSTEDKAVEPLGSDHEGGGHLCDTESHEPNSNHDTVYQVQGHHIPLG